MPPARSGRGPVRISFFLTPISEAAIGWQPVQFYETRGIRIPPAEVENVPTTCYWEQKLLSQCEVTLDTSASEYFSRMPAAKISLFAALCEELVLGVKGAQIIVVDDLRLLFSDSVPIFGLHAFPAAAGGKPSLVVYFMGAQRKGERPVVLSEVPAGTQAEVRYNASNFPDDLAAQDFWARYPSIAGALRGWVAAQGADEQTTVISFQLPNSPTFTLVANVKATGSDSVRDLNLFWADDVPIVSIRPDEYVEKDLIDHWLETANARAADGSVTSIHSIVGLAKLTPSERFSVKRAILAYAGNRAFDSEVDCRLPVAGEADSVLFTLHFQPVPGSTVKECDVIVTKSLTSFPPGGLRGLLANSDDPIRFLPPCLAELDGATLTSWWNRRHPVRPVTEGGSDAAAVRRQIGRYLSRPLDAAWFRENYGLFLLNPAQGTAWLRDEWQLAPAQIKDVSSFSPDEMLQIELSLLCMDEPTIEMLRDVRLIRQKVGPKNFDNEKMHQGGLTRVQGAKASINIYDAANLNSDALFVGGANYPWACWAETFVHEVGHVLASKNGIEAAFNEAFKSARAPTWYAGSAPETEFIAEAFMLYVLNPKWLQDNRPELYQWLRQTCTTGQPAVAARFPK